MSNIDGDDFMSQEEILHTLKLTINAGTKDFAEAVCDFMEEEFGTWNYKAFKEVVDKRLKTD